MGVSLYETRRQECTSWPRKKVEFTCVVLHEPVDITEEKQMSEKNRIKIPSCVYDELADCESKEIIWEKKATSWGSRFDGEACYRRENSFVSIRTEIQDQTNTEQNTK